VRSYPAEVAPFAAVARAGDAVTDGALAEILAPGGAIYFAHQLPSFVGTAIAEPRPSILQMRWTAPRLPAPGRSTPPIRDLGDADLDAMIDLTARAFPGYFRRRTSEMGRYVGIVEDGRLTAMGGERLVMTGYCEVSAICTDPAFTGRGYAHAIVAHVVGRLLDDGVTPFLHVDTGNTRAQAVYRSVGFGESVEVKLLRVRRDQDSAARGQRANVTLTPDP
jgi:GNAT superfamily N-acetyltransferase